jgi:hypothetical protein
MTVITQADFRTPGVLKERNPCIEISPECPLPHLTSPAMILFARAAAHVNPVKAGSDLISSTRAKRPNGLRSRFCKEVLRPVKNV